MNQKTKATSASLYHRAFIHVLMRAEIPFSYEDNIQVENTSDGISFKVMFPHKTIFVGIVEYIDPVTLNYSGEAICGNEYKLFDSHMPIKDFFGKVIQWIFDIDSTCYDLESFDRSKI